VNDEGREKHEIEGEGEQAFKGHSKRYLPRVPTKFPSMRQERLWEQCSAVAGAVVTIGRWGTELEKQELQAQ
jgi:hypothetical protein